MAVQVPTPEQLRAAAAEVGLSLTDADVQSYIGLIKPNVDVYNLIDAMPDYLPIVKYPRSPGYFPSPEENARNAWYVKTSIKGADSGPLKGKKIAVKDNIMVAGVPMMNGCSILEGYVPEIDATVVQRLLDAGAEIVGKTHCESYCISGGSHTGAKGAVHNPYKMGYAAGGSSSGSGVVVALGEADMALGGDQGGSIRIPSGWCGIYGMKPTHGLVPYTGIMPIEIFVDHTGPMTATVADNALMLEVLAGPDGYDPRQYAPKVQKYTQALGGSVKGMRIALVKEGFNRPESERAVDEKVRQGAEQFRKLGATVEDVSIPMHLLGPAIWTPIGVEGIAQTMMFGDGYGLSRPDLYVTSMIDKLHGWQLRANELSETTKVLTTLGTYIKKYHGSRYYGKAVNLTRRLSEAYDNVLKQYDLLLMPTLPMKAQPLPPADAPRELYLQRALEMIGNTSPFDITHHPAMTVPCGMIDGLPAGLMLIGKHYDESTIYRAAHAFEEAGDWKKM
ncbi:MAG TPA: amidase [Burkholderiales bacterium]|nr:amidase [Burkholderiales bacterium]